MADIDEQAAAEGQETFTERKVGVANLQGVWRDMVAVLSRVM